MGRTYTVNGKQIDTDDTKAIQALTNDEFTELFKLVKDTAPIDEEHTVPPTLVEREPGAGFLIMPAPAASPEDEEKQP